MYVGVNTSGEIQGIWPNFPPQPHSAIMLELPEPVEHTDQIEVIMEDRWPLPSVPVAAQIYPKLMVSVDKDTLAADEEATATVTIPGKSTETQVYLRAVAGEASTDYVAAAVADLMATQVFSFDSAGEYLIEAYSPKHGRARVQVTVA
jgi:hypothetical protein